MSAPAAERKTPKDFLSIADWPRDAIEGMLARALELKDLRRRRVPVRSLEGASVLLYFAKPSLRTFVTFEVGVAELGGFPVYLPPGQVQIGEREPPEDVARNLSRWCHGIVARTYGHDVVTTLAANSSVPVINALTDWLHPCQALADALTILEHGDLRGDTLCYVGDGNNMCHSLINLAACLGMSLVVSTPHGYAPDPAVVRPAQERAVKSGAAIHFVADPREAVKGAAFIYTDVWASMGQESEAEARRRVFRPFQVNAELVALAPGARILHCLPAHRGEEITADVFESSRALVFDQAENRLHAQKAILELLIAG
ncbi:MAG TPA: ornithine carbamoyltransferase [Myxococcota bacterium]|nr:ornithine carbamoyltransferase [Myxococcota bacterium]